MNTETVLVIVVSVLSAACASWLIVMTRSVHGRFTLDSDLSGKQKYHVKPVPRIGGVAFFIGMVIGGIYHGMQADSQLFLSKWAGVAALPVFLGGLLEDLTKNVSARNRLLLAFISAAIGYYELGIGLTTIGWPWFDDNMLTQPGVALMVTIVMVGGVAHSTNIIDGFHGLLLGVSILVLSAFMYVTILAGGDSKLITYMGIMLGALIGLMLFNFPKGKIFMGDGGAYLVGFLLAVLALLMVRRFDNISPWFPLLALIYPVFETLFSIFRKRLLSRQPAMSPDSLHLHMLVYRHLGDSAGGILCLNRNAATSVVMWCMASLAIVPAVIWWDQTQVLQFLTIAYCLIYSLTYVWLAKKHTTAR